LDTRFFTGQSHRLGHCLGVAAAAVIEPALGVKPRLRTSRLSAGKQFVDATGDPFGACVRRADSGRPIAGLDRAEANDLGKLADRLEQRPQPGHRSPPGSARPGVLYRRVLQARH
jgi:hypothetical protein